MAEIGEAVQAAIVGRADTPLEARAHERIDEALRAAATYGTASGDEAAAAHAAVERLSLEVTEATVRALRWERDVADADYRARRAHERAARIERESLARERAADGVALNKCTHLDAIASHGRIATLEAEVAHARRGIATLGSDLAAAAERERTLSERAERAERERDEESAACREWSLSVDKALRERDEARRCCERERARAYKAEEALAALREDMSQADAERARLDAAERERKAVLTVLARILYREVPEDQIPQRVRTLSAVIDRERGAP
jgi:hypothetical protein